MLIVSRVFSPVRFKAACKYATLLNIYGSTEVGADASYAVLCIPDTPPAAIGVTAVPLCADTSQTQIPQGNGPKSQADNTAHQGTNRDPGSSMRTPWLTGNAPIGFPITGNELIIARSCKYVGSDDDTVRSDDPNSDQEYFEIVSDGEPGELFVGGKQLAAGYHNRPEETAKRFLPRSIIRGAGADAGAGTDAGTGTDVLRYPNSTDSTNRMSTTDRVFRTGDIVVRIPKGIDGPGSDLGTGCAGRCGGGEVEWAGALMWLGRSDLQVPARMPYGRYSMAAVLILLDSFCLISLPCFEVV